MFRLFSLIIVIYTIGSTVCTTDRFITGKVTHAESNKIEKTSRVQIELRDTSLMDTVAKLIASTSVSDAKTFPFSYKLQYNPSEIKPHHTYSLSARITGPDGALQFINDVRTRVDFSTSTSPVVNIAVIRVGGSLMNDKKVCGPVKCPGKPKACPYGYQKLDGCEICRCHDPCNPPGKPILCGSKQRCFIDKKPDGTFTTRCGALHPGKNRLEARCRLPKTSGPCEANIPSFYYNSSTKTCESFTYGGCQGNRNRFTTKAQCEKTCTA